MYKILLPLFQFIQIDSLVLLQRVKFSKFDSPHCFSFHKWMLQLEENFNLVFFGLGSKRSLLVDFQTRMLADKNVVVVNGFFPSVTVKQILNGITSELVGTDTTFSSTTEHVKSCLTLRRKMLGSIRSLLFSTQRETNFENSVT